MAHLVRVRRWISGIALAGTIHFLTAAPAAAQCILCYTGAAGSGDRGIRALRIGILILLIPALTIFGGLFWMAVRRRNSNSAGTDGAEMDSRWEEGLTTLQVSPGTDGPSPRV